MTSRDTQSEFQTPTNPPSADPAREAPAAPTATAAPSAQESHESSGGKVLHMHTAHPRMSIPYVTPGDMFTGARGAAREAVRGAGGLLPSPRKLAFYGLLGGMTAAGAMAWPVAVAMGAATEVITREQAARQHEEHERMERARSESERSGSPTGDDRTEPRTASHTGTV
ncbi:hypothetical protein ACWD4G_44675 [Streptomyces sp. NPDC002643]